MDRVRQNYEAGKEAILAGEFTKALAAFDAALAGDSRDAKAHDGRGVALVLLNRRVESEASFREAIRLDDRFAEAHFNLDKLLLESSRIEEARGQLQAAVDLEPHHAPSIRLLIDTFLALHDERAGVRLLESLHKTHVSHSAQLHLDLGAALQDHAMRDEARNQYSLALADDPTPDKRREAELALSRLCTR